MRRLRTGASSVERNATHRSSLGKSAVVFAVALVTVLATITLINPARAVAPSAPWQPSATTPYSNPTWMPVRSPIQMSCTHSNCPGPFHNYWAIDMVGALGTPIYAAGAGVLHVGGTGTACTNPGTSVNSGTWVWIDHGAGLVSRYHHLNSITVADGTRVTPATRIGTMGHSGDFKPCTTNYLHFEVRTGGVKGTRINPGPLAACTTGTRVTFPNYWGVTSWNSLPPTGRTTPELDDTCHPSSTTAPSTPATIAGTRGSAAATIKWTRAASGHTATNYVVSQALWSPSVPGWNAPVYRTVNASTSSTTFTGLTNGRRYRYQVFARNSTGVSAATKLVEVVPATRPRTPATGRWLTSTKSTLRYAWWKSTAQGTPVTSYTVAIRRRTATAWKPWNYTTVTPATLNRYWTGLPSGATYQITVRANSTAGSSPWGAHRSITTRR